jgi:hypothetical protein
MIYRNLGNKAHEYIHFVALAGIAFGLPLNKVVMSIAMMVGLLNLLVQANFGTYWKRIKANQLFILISLFWFLHIIGLLWTTNSSFAFNDIRVKLPLIVIPLLFTIQPIEFKEQKWLLRFFLGSLILTSLYNFLSYQQLFGYRDYNDIRGLSLFGSHIRYGILIAFGAVISLFQFFKTTSGKIIYLLLFIWFTYYTYFSQIISGTLAIVFGCLSLIFLILYQYRKVYAYILGIIVFVIPAAAIISNLSEPIKSPISEKDLPKLPLKTREGNDYVHYFVDTKDSKGNYLFVNLCEDELRREWNNVSSFDYDSLDEKGQEIRFTLIRYMTSMGLKKDAENFHKLKKKDVSNIEEGIAEKEDGRTGIMARINGIRFQLLANADPNGHSLLQRLEYWRTSLKIIQQNWLFGVGTGDLQMAFDEQYEQDNSKLNKENRLRAHNTYLTVWITFGVLSLLFFFLIVKYFLAMIKYENYLGLAFITIAIVTFFIEDTLETQTGVTFFSFFYGLFLGKKIE